jgi:ATP-binding protein involved in chromosome partitioning
LRTNGWRLAALWSIQPVTDAISVADLQARFARVIDPELGLPLGELRMIRDVVVSDAGEVTVTIELPTPAYPNRQRISEALLAAVTDLSPAPLVSTAFRVVTKGKNTGGSIGLKVKNVIAVGSGKGGVGKSTVAATLAYGLQLLGAEVGLMDADVYGPSIPHLVGSQGQPVSLSVTTPSGETKQRIQPLVAHGLRVMSMGYFLKPDQAVIWRGPLLHRAITQFLQDTDWGDLDYLIIDLPPGTGDVSLTLSQLLGLAGAIVVCTPQQVALLDAVKAVSMYRQVKIPILGMVENMVGDVFGRGGVRAKAAELGLPCLGEIPIDPQIRISGDEGRIYTLFDETSPVRGQLIAMCQAAAMQIAKECLTTRAMPTLEIL